MKKKDLRILSKFSEFQVERALSQELPYWEFLDGSVALADGSLVQGFSLRGLATETLDTQQINQMALELRSFLNGLPDGVEISFYREVSSDFENLLNQHAALKGDDKNIGWVSDCRLHQLKNAAQDEEILTPKLFLFIYSRFDAEKTAGSFVSRLFQPPKRFQSVRREVHERRSRELGQLGASVANALQSTGMIARALPQDELRHLIYRFLNPTRAGYSSQPKPSNEYQRQEFLPDEISRLPELAHASPREQLVFSDLVQGYDFFMLDGIYYRVISLKSLPEFTHAAMISKLSSLPFPHTLEVHVRVPDQSRELSSLQSKRRMAHSMSLSHGGRATDIESEARLQSTEELLREIIDTGQKILYFQSTILIGSRSNEELQAKTKATLARIRELNGAEAIAETTAAFKVWKSMLPLGNTTMVRAKRVKTDNLADLIPVYEPYDGQNHREAKPVCLFRNRYSGLVQYDPFDPSLPNYNGLVTGSSGAGKSFLNNLILLQYLTQNPMVFVIDIGGSYRKLCEFVGGQYVEIVPSRDGSAVDSINPMGLPSSRREPSPAKIKFLLSFLENLFTDDESSKLPKFDKSILEEAVLETYRRFENPTLGTLAKFLLENSDPLLSRYGKMLYPWTGDRPYGRLLDAQTSLSFNSDFVVFDLKGLSSYPDLQAAMILIITDFVMGRIEETKGRHKQIYIDECWEQLKYRGSQTFMEYAVRTLRKMASGITFITQGLEEIVSSPIGSAILSNTATKFILLQRGDLRKVQETLKLNNQETSLVSSLRQVKGRYSEAFMIRDDKRSVIQIHPTPVEYWLATTDASDNRLLEERRNETPNGNLADVVRDLSLSHPYGAHT